MVANMQLEFGGTRHPIPAGESAIGTSSDGGIVLPGGDARSWHAVLDGSPVGVTIRAMGEAPVLVNGVRIGEAPTPLMHGDRVTVAGHEITAIDPGRGSRTPLFEVTGAEAATFVAPSGAVYRLADTMHGMPAFRPAAVGADPAAGAPAATGLSAASRAAPRVALASFLLRSGAHKGERLQVHAVSLRIGRAESSDLVIDDPSVSAEHARLRRRDGLWILTDAGSINGTFVDGEPVTDEAPLVPGASVRFGGVTALFEPYDEPADDVPAGVAEQMGVAPPQAETYRSETSRAEAQPEEAPPPAAPRRAVDAPPAPATDAGRGFPAWLVAAVLAAAAAGAAVGFVLLR